MHAQKVTKCQTKSLFMEAGNAEEIGSWTEGQNKKRFWRKKQTINYGDYGHNQNNISSKCIANTTPIVVLN